MTIRRTSPGLLCAAGVLLGALLWSPGPSTAVAPPLAGAILSTGQTEIGVNATGDLIFDGRGIAFNGEDGLTPGCPCEGWGAGDAASMVSGFAGRDFGVSPNLSVDSFTATTDTAVSVTTISTGTGDPVLRVTHDYHPSAAPDLFEVTVTIQNVSGAAVEPRYRRAMDWDIPPTPFDEFVTIQGSETAEAVLFASDDGFAFGDPFAGPSHINFVGDAVDNRDTVLTPGGSGPDSDHGALFDFGFDPLAPGETFEFNIYYGAAGAEADAIDALNAISAEVYSFGQPSSPDGATLGVPNTFIFAFAGVGGLVQFPDVRFASATHSVQEDQGAAVIGVELSGPTALPVTVTYKSSPGTATPGADYTEVSGELVIPVGGSSGSFEVPVVNDRIPDDGETVVLTISDPVNARLGEPKVATLTIHDPTPEPLPRQVLGETVLRAAPRAQAAVPVTAAPRLTG